jgi:hypothetical protein
MMQVSYLGQPSTKIIMDRTARFQGFVLLSTKRCARPKGWGPVHPITLPATAVYALVEQLDQLGEISGGSC